MPPPLEEWWKWHIVLPLSVRPPLSTSDVSILRVSFSGGASVSFGHISSSKPHYLLLQKKFQKEIVLDKQ